MSEIKTNSSKKSIIIIRMLIFIVGACILALWLYVHNNNLDFEWIEVSSADIPAEFDGFRIAVVSDVHGKEYGEGSERLLALIRRCEPDLIAITGDLAENEKEFMMVGPLCRGLSDIAPLYYVTGNHEWGSRTFPKLHSILNKSGANVLQNRYEPIVRGGAFIVLAGIDDPNAWADMKPLPEFMEEIRGLYGGAYTVLLSHRYERFDEYIDNDVNLTLCGHAHGGLIRLPFTDGLIGPRRDFLPKHTSGLYEKDGNAVVVSRGIGNTLPSFRVFNRPHVPIVVLRSDNSGGEVER